MTITDKDHFSISWAPSDFDPNVSHTIAIPSFREQALSDFTVPIFDYALHFDAIQFHYPFRTKSQQSLKGYSYGKPFALLMPLIALESERMQQLYREHAWSCGRRTRL